jgi:hypothetical protein
MVAKEKVVGKARQGTTSTPRFFFGEIVRSVPLE